MKFIIFILVVALSPPFIYAQTKEELKKKYEKSNLDEETYNLMKSDNIYPDNIILPPLHYTNSFYILNNETEDFESMSMDVEILNKIPENYYFYISLFNTEFNQIPFYSGIQSKGDGIDVRTGKQEDYIPFTGIFSRWYEREKNALKTDGYYASSDSEGDFISVRKPVAWNKGSYRITLKKDGYIEGKALPENINEKDKYFIWGEYEHTWLTMTVNNLKTNETSVIGSLAFPGKKIRMSNEIVSFLEQYKDVIDFAEKPRPKIFENIIYYKDIPYIKVIQRNLLINGKPADIKSVKTYHNRTYHPDQKNIDGKIPVLSTDKYNLEKKELILETGILNKGL